ncbi:diguanylate cyclase/phosphodiesterasewith PAS/PAC sensor [Pseudanabaena sp. lw0831]|uniref:sensor domain-containing protein n=1 Tax=Pseudanabaena sp. lw0831 TaxID=1357935 RepID=UPI0019165207|nr:EAL domain-containing protein [Pseudanabaena sp. lw0831]GBO56633.1 diguanylate cyclase/phosphodiesterasewith PAS/PAC sensor [Pseudanabaena sp. lw0831]
MAERYKHLNPIYQEILKQERLKNLMRIAKCIENSTVGVFETTLDDQIRGISVSFCDLLGYSSEQICQLKYEQICHPDDLSAYYFLKERLLSGEIDHCYLNVRYIREDGQIVQVLQSTDLDISGSKEPHFVNRFEDITDWEQTAKNQQDFENRTRYLFENNPNPMWIYDLETLGFLAVNQAAINHYGYSEDEFLSMTLQDIRPPEDMPKLLEAIAKVSAGFSVPEVWRHCKKDGTHIFVDVSAHTLDYKNRKCELILVNDVTQKMQAEEALKLAEAKYRGIFEHAIEGIFQSTVDGRFLISNPMLAEIYGYASPEDLIANLTDIEHQLYVDPQRRLELIKLLEEQEDVKFFESEVYRQDKSIIWTSENVHAVRDKAGDILYFEGTVEDITSSKRAKAEIEHLAFHDSLTNLPNRVLFRDRLSTALVNAHEQLQIDLDQKNLIEIKSISPILAVMFLDLDRFKLVNDTMGHAAGDRLLIEVAKRLSECMFDRTFLARMGGDEFMILVPELQSVESIQQFAQMILQSFESPFFVEEMSLYIGTSIGISLYPNDGTDEETLMKNADTAMFRAKERGRNHYQLYNHAIGAKVKEYVAIENGIRQALERSEFQVFYQPQINLVTGEIDCMEALARWLHPDLGWVPPNQFIPAAEEHGLIVRLGEWVLRTACAQNRAWQRQGLPPIRMAVNFSSKQFQVVDLCDRIMQILTEIDLEPQYLEIEITESLVMQDQHITITMLKELKSLGMSVSIDDFGTGYSSLSYLRLLPVSKVKIDASFIRETPQNKDDAAITSAIIAMAHNLNLRVIAEGVERKEQLEFLRSHDCDAVQGYLFSRPVPAHEATLLLQAQLK